jgi:cysteinyl-tRNA synthetase
MKSAILVNSKKEIFELTPGKKYNWYTCGPTIYNRSHLGHARTFITLDFMRRFYESIEIEIIFGMNITDIDDKIIKKVIDKNEYKSIDKMRSYYEFIHEYDEHFLNDLKSINIKKPNIILRVSEIITQIIDFIMILIDKDFAYCSNKSVYFNVKKYYETFPLSHLDRSNNNDLNIKDSYSSEKNDPRDFALWKNEKDDDISFSSPWGKGRPGWHIECSVLSNIMFRDTIDIHSGGIDLLFPHHNNELLQSTAYHEKDVFNNFIHIGHLYINGDKMSQSIGNTITIESFVKKYSSNILRILFMLSKWDSQFEIKDNDIIEQAKNIDSSIYELITTLNDFKESVFIFESDIITNDVKILIDKYTNMLDDSLINNFDTIKFCYGLQDMIKNINIYIKNIKDLSRQDFSLLYQLLQKYTNIIGLTYNLSDSDKKYILAIVEIRNKLKNTIESVTDKDTKKNLFSISDYIRDDVVLKLGYKLDDKASGIKFKKI